MMDFNRRQFLIGATTVAAGAAFWDIGASYKRQGQLWLPQGFAVAPPELTVMVGSRTDFYVKAPEMLLSSLKVGDLMDGRLITEVDYVTGDVGIGRKV